MAQVILHCLLTLADPTPTLEGLWSVILEEKSSFSLQVWQGWRGARVLWAGAQQLSWVSKVCKGCWLLGQEVARDTFWL